MAEEVFSLFALLKIDKTKFDEGLGKAKDGLNKFSTGAKKVFSVIGKTSAAALGAAATGVTAMIKKSAAAYGEYEQLVGGVETLFGDSAAKVIKDSEQAFKTAGMSMNEYMQTSIQSAASLINSLDGDQKKAAEMMNMSITDMADKMLVR